MSTLSERIRLLLEEVGDSPTRMAKIAGVQAPSVSDWLNGKTKTLKSAPAISIARHFDVNLIWLTEGKGPMRDGASKNHKPEENPAVQEPEAHYGPSTTKISKRLAEAEAALPNFDLLAAAIDGLISYAFASSRAQSIDKPAAEDDSPQTQPPKPQPTGLRGNQFSSRTAIEKHHAGQAKTKKSK